MTRFAWSWKDYERIKRREERKAARFKEIEPPPPPAPPPPPPAPPPPLPERELAGRTGKRLARSAMVAVSDGLACAVMLERMPKAAPAPVPLDNFELRKKGLGVWCEQCDALVGRHEAEVCVSRFCKAKTAIAQPRRVIP